MKKWFYLLMSLALLAAVLWTAPDAAAAETHPHTAEGHCVCGGAVEGHACQSITDWQTLSGTVDFGTLASGNYYLTGDVTVQTASYIGAATKISDTEGYRVDEACDLVICLNGYNITCSTDRTFKGVLMGSSLTITDCSYDAQSGTWGGTVIGGTSVNGGIAYTYAQSTTNIYGGNFTAKEGASNTNGGLFVVAQDRGTGADSRTDETQYSEFNIFNGRFYGGSAKYGGNFNVMHYSHMNIYGGIIENGTATATGGNIHVGTNSVLNIQASRENPVVIRNGSANKNGNITFYDPVNLTGVTLYNGTPEVAGVVSGTMLQTQYTTLSDAVAAAAGDSTKYVRMLANVTEAVTVSSDLYIDLAGHNVSGLTCTGAVYGMDSTTDAYNGDSAGTLTMTGTPERHIRTTNERVGTVKRYLAVEENGSYSFHRFYLGVTTVVLAPDRNGMGYRACFAGDEAVKGALQDYGMAVSFDPLSENLEEDPYRTKTAEQFTAGEPFYQKLIVKNILSEDTADNHERASTDIYARCFIRLSDGTILFSAQEGGNLLELTEQVNDCWSSYNDTQKKAVSNMVAEYPLSISGWGVENAHHYDSSVWQPWTGTWKNGGHYYLTADYTLKSTITVPYGQSLSICLNGHQFVGTASRMFKVYGTLNIHDHQDENGDYAGVVSSTYGSSVMAPVFYIYENGTMNLCGGNLRYEGSGTMTRGGVGMVGSSDTSSDTNTTADQAWFNMYYGTISGGTVQAVLKSDGTVDGSKNGLGGNLDLVDKANVNLYRGKIFGGTTTYVEAASMNGEGGNISVDSSGVVLNMYNVEVTGGSSGVYVYRGTVNLNGGVKITGNEAYNLYIASGKKVNTGDLSGASVGVTMGGSGSFTTVTDEAYAECFTSDVANIWVINESGALSMGHGHCVCGKSAEGVADHVCEGLKFQALPTTTTDFSKLGDGHYYLTGDLTVSSCSHWNSQQNISICLNGYNITTTTGAPFGYIRADAQLNICDCSGHQDESGAWSWNGTVYAGNRNYGGVVNVNANGRLNVYGGNFVGGDSGVSGGVFNVCNDGYAYADSLPEDANQYSEIYTTAFNMYNGYVKGGTVTTNGGAINCWHHVDVNIYGGTVTGGTSGEHGGNICAGSGTLRIINAVVSDGTAGTDAGNIYIAGNGEAYLTGATVTGGTATARGGNIYIASGADTYLDDATVSGGTAQMGGGVFNYMATVHVEGSTVIDGNENYNLHQFLSKAVDVGTLESSAKIGIYSEIKGKLLNTASYTSCFYSEDSNYKLVAYSGNTMYLPTSTSLSYSSVSSFSAGFGKVDISPTENGVPLGGYGTSSTRLSTEVDENGRLYVMTTAVTDENGNTILIVACDQIRFTDTVTDILREHMSAATGVPAANIYINCSHTHSVPDPATTDDVSLRYRVHMYNGFVESAIAAMKDRKAATMQTGSFEVTGVDGTGTLNYVRHYQHTDAEGVVHYFGDNFGTAVYDETTKHVSEADPTMFLIKFTRSGTDILLVNWRAHPHFTGGSAKTVVSSDYVGPFRDAAEELLGDYHVAFLQGAAGNVNEKSRTQLGDNHGLDYIGYGQELAKQLKNNLSCLKTVSTGIIQTKQVKFTANVDHETDDQIEDAKLVSSTYWDLDSDARKALLEQYGFSSVYHAGAIIARYNMAQTLEVEVNVFSIGDQVGFYTVPGELWDTASVIIEEGSPFPITICVGYSLGDYKYFTHGLAWTYESYETANYRLTVPDTLNKMMEIWSSGLDELYENA